jgi:acyl-CoA synthetase (AMP-forming)/AMP-acid ligase II
LYKTGDIGRWIEDGTIEIMGRIDAQVKIRGYRIEMGEIESTLLEHESIQDCVVMVRDHQEAEQEIKKCKKCGISSRYPGSEINDEGFCRSCMNYQQYKKIIDAYFKTPGDLEMLIKEKNKDSQNTYDCLLLYAGGRGAAYALYQLKNMDYNI